MEYFLDLHLKSAANIKKHWRERAMITKVLRSAAYWETVKNINKIHEITPPLVITLTRISPRKLDEDNLLYAFKPIRDGIADVLWPELSHVKRDDHDGVQWLYTQEKGESKIKISIK